MPYDLEKDVPMWAKDFPYIYLFGKEIGSHATCLRDEVDTARRTGAPANATHELTERHTGKHLGWSTTDDCTNMSLRVRLGLPATAPVLRLWLQRELNGYVDRLERLRETLAHWEAKGDEAPADSPEQEVHYGAMSDGTNTELAARLAEVAENIRRKLA